MVLNKIWHIVGLTLLVTGGWCVYFDQKRKKGVKEKKNKVKSRRLSKDALQIFFLQEIDFGEKLLMAGDLEGSVEHFVNAVVVCQHPGQLLAVLKQNLPKPVYSRIKSEIKGLSV